MAEERKRTSSKVVTETVDNLISMLQLHKREVLKWLNEGHDESMESYSTACDELKVATATREYLEQIVGYPREDVADIIVQGNRHLGEFTHSMEKVVNYHKNHNKSHQNHYNNHNNDNVFDVRAYCREITSQSQHLDNAKYLINLICSPSVPNDTTKKEKQTSDCSDCSGCPPVFVANEVVFNKKM